MLPQKFFDVLKHEGVVSLTTWGRDVPHVTNTWNSYLVITDDERESSLPQPACTTWKKTLPSTTASS